MNSESSARKTTLILNLKRIGHHLKLSDSLLWVLLLSVVTVISRVVLMLLMPGPQFYYDSYKYFSQASDFIGSGIMPSVDPPFTILLALWVAAFGAVFDPLIAARFLNIVLAVITSFCLFDLTRRFLGDEFAFVSTMLIMMEPIFLTFSITTHNDVFTMMTAVISLNWAFSQRRIFYVLGAPVSFMLAVSSKPFLYIVLGIPIILIYMHRILRWKKSKKFKLAVLLSGLLMYSVIPLSPVAQEYYYRQTRFDPVTKATIFLRPEIIQFVIEKVFLITNINFIDVSFWVLFILGNVLVLYTLLEKVRPNSKAIGHGTIQFLPLFMLIIVYLSIIAFCIFVIPYTIVSGTVIPILDLNKRYLLWPHFAILWVSAFALWKIISIIVRHPGLKHEGSF